MVPRARYRVTRPSGATPTALMPAPQTTATPQCGPDPSSPSTASGRPERRMAKVSLTTVALSLHPWACTAVACSASSSGRSALARQATVCRASGPSGRWSSCAPSWAAACLTTASRISTVWSTPTSCALMPGPRAEASSVPSLATSATSVLLLPPSMASTAGSRARGSGRGSSGLSAKAGTRHPLLRAQGERQQGVGGVVVGEFDRGPGGHVVLVGAGLGVVRAEMARTAGSHAGDRAQRASRGQEPDLVLPGQPQPGEAELVHRLVAGVPRAQVTRGRAPVGDAVRRDDLEPHHGDLPGEHRERRLRTRRRVSHLIDPDYRRFVYSFGCYNPRNCRQIPSAPECRGR